MYTDVGQADDTVLETIIKNMDSWTLAMLRADYNKSNNGQKG